MIVGHQTYPIDIPHEPGNQIVIRDLSGLEMDDARDASSRKSLKRYAEMGDILATLRENRTQETEIDEKQIDPKALYDWEYLLTHAIVGWNGPNYNDITCDNDNKRLLDKKTMDWLIGEIIERNTVPAGE